MINPEDISQEVVDAFVSAWEAKRKEIGRGIAEPGTKVRAGLVAALGELGILAFLGSYENDIASDGYTITPDMNKDIEHLRKALGREWPT